MIVAKDYEKIGARFVRYVIANFALIVAKFVLMEKSCATVVMGQKSRRERERDSIL